jgi:DNA mismatch endonuclease (patch repair protein)
MDVHSPAQRSFNMSRIRGKDTGPELAVRRVLFRLGYRYRLNVRNLPGTPDIVMPKHRLVLFVHGCFWHSHSCRYGAVKVGTRQEFWQSKRQKTVERDKKNIRALKELGWKVVQLWECDIKAATKAGRLPELLMSKVTPLQ